MERARHLETLAVDSRLLGDAAAVDMEAAVPFCPGWVARDVVVHVAEVYEHKIAAIGAGGPHPDPWPPRWPEHRDPLEWFGDVRARLIQTLTDTDPTTTCWTWSPQDQTAGFWVRRMAQETAVHRVDAEGATGVAGPIDRELALDGIDEALSVMLAGDWSEHPQTGLTGTVNVVADQRTWHVEMSAEEVTVVDGAHAADAAVAGPPGTLLLWIWGRAPTSTVELSGDGETAGRLRERLALAQ